MDEFGVPEYKQHNDGDAMMIVDGKKHRYGGTIPWTDEPVGRRQPRHRPALDREDVQIDSARSPLGGKDKPHEWDRISLGEWLDKNTMSKQAREMLDMALAGVYTSAASETSLLWALTQMGSAGSPASAVLPLSSRARAALKMPARSAGWAPSIGRSPPNWATRCTFRGRFARLRRTLMVSRSAPTI